MIKQERVLELYERANPVKDVDQLVTDLEAASYLANLQDRSSEVTQLDTRPTEQERSSRRTLIAVAAAAVVILGTALVLLTRDSEEPPVATDTPPTTIVTPTTTPEATEELTPELEEALAVATAFTEARRDRDIAGMNANGVEGHMNGFIVSSLEAMPDEFAWQDAVGWVMEVQGCEVTNPELSRTTIRCDVVHNNTISQALGEGPYEGAYHMKVMYSGDEKLGVPITETTVTESLQLDFPSFQFTVGTWRPFIAWVQENYPQDIDTMLAGEVQSGDIEMMLAIGERRPSLSQESIDLWRQHMAEFVAEQS